MHRKYELCLRLSSEEQAQLECDARRCGLSKTAYLRRLILGAEIKARPTQEIDGSVGFRPIETKFFDCID